MKQQPRTTALTTSLDRFFMSASVVGGTLFLLMSHASVAAQTTPFTNTVNTELQTSFSTLVSVLSFVSTTTSLIVAGIFLFFFYSVYKFVKSEGDDKAAARTNMLWSVVGIVVFSTLWGGVAFIRALTGIDTVDDAGNTITPGDVEIPQIEPFQPIDPNDQSQRPS